MHVLRHTPVAVALLGSLHATAPSATLTVEERLQMLWERSDAQASAGKWDAAVETGRHATRLFPDNADAWALRANGYAMHPEAPRQPAQEAAERALALEPTCARAHYVLALLDWYAMELPAAEEKLHEAIGLDPGLARAHEVLGMVLSDQGRGEEGIASLREATRLDPKSVDAHLNLAWTLYWHGHVREALAETRAGLDRAWLDADKAILYNNAAYFHAAAGEGDRAIEAARRARALHPEDTVYSIDDTLGSMLALFGDAKQAEWTLRKSVSDHGLTSSRAAVAYTQALQGRDAEARERLAAIREALIEEHVSIDALYFAARAYEALGEGQVARRIARRVTDVWPDHPWASELRERFPPDG